MHSSSRIDRVREGRHRHPCPTRYQDRNPKGRRPEDAPVTDPTLLRSASRPRSLGVSSEAKLLAANQKSEISGDGAVMWFSPSVGATGRLVRPAYRTPFGVDKPTIWGRATAVRTARHSWTYSTNYQYNKMQNNDCESPCRVPLRPTRSLRSLLEAGGSILCDADTVGYRRDGFRHPGVSKIFT